MANGRLEIPVTMPHIEREREREEEGTGTAGFIALSPTLIDCQQIAFKWVLVQGGVAIPNAANKTVSLGLALAIEIVSQSLHFTKVARQTKKKKTKNHFIILEIELFFAFQQLLIIFFLLAAAVADKGNNSAKDECKANNNNNNDNSIYLL